ncbi:MAG: glycosyltransferase family 2 protein [Cytophagaceae bacterium]|jgi:cellulose synthase/poly-beta-1,6-N-acetylglucosamine synthase-like glycosyltransferase|nr:glycosyltransferase family 2 protein [Cytophagaceae bacterium]
MKQVPFISVVLPIRNEEKFIEATLSAIARQNYPNTLLEILISDGMSTDSTKEIVYKFKNSNTNLSITLIDNPEKIVPYGLNRAIRVAKGKLIVRMDSHSVYPDNYIETLVDALYEHDADNTGGVVETVPYRNTVKCHAIATALSHPMGVGNSYFRIGSSKVREVDTVPFGCFRREVFDKIGFFDEELIRNQDDEFNGRMINNGMKILLIPNVIVKYFARDSFSKLYKMYYQYGLFKPLTVKKLGKVPTLRQLIPMLFVLFLLGGALLSLFLKPLWLFYGAGLLFYVMALTLISVRQAVAKKMLKMTFPLVFSFFILHFSYGWGYLYGLIALIFGIKSVFKNKTLSRD